MKTIKSTCSYCGVGCGVNINKFPNGSIKVEGDPDYPVNKGMLCSKGMNLHYVVENKSDRLLYPEMRYGKGQPRKRISWDTAMERGAAVFKTIIDKYGPDAVGFYVSGQCLTEEYYLVNKLTKGYIGTNNIDTNSRLCMSSAVVGYKKVLGDDIVPGSYEDIELSDCFLIAGANPAWCHPILYRRLEAHKNENPEAKIIVVDPRKTQTCAIADIHLQIKPGTDIVLFNAIARRLIETGAIDQDFIKNNTLGFTKLLKVAYETSIIEASIVCDVPIEDIETAADYIGNAKAFMTMWTMGLNQSSEGVNKNLALLNLSLITGQIGKPGTGPFSLTGQPNAMGGREVGGMANLLAVHLDQANPDHRKQIAEFWGVPSMPDKPGKTATEMFEALRDGSMKAIWIVCTNPMVSLPDSNLVEEALQKAKFVVVQDISSNADTLEHADLILPAAGWAEKEGAMTNSERRISYLGKAIDAPGEALPDSEIFIKFAKAMGFSGFDFNSSSDVYDEYCQQTKGTSIDISGLNYDRLKKERSIQWPVPNKAHPGTPRMFEDQKFHTPSKKAAIHGVETSLKSDHSSDEYPLILTTGRIRDQWHTMTRTGKVNKLKQHIDRPYLELNPIDALLREIEDGDTVLISNTKGEVQVQAKISEEIRSGVVFLPMHWGKILGNSFARTNNLTQNKLDPVSKQPEFKYSAVQVKKKEKPKEKIVVVGAGAAAFRFIHTYREFNKTDEILVFSKEAIPFYNRVLLPEYVNNLMDWKQLEKFKDGEIEKLNFNIEVSTGIEYIDRKSKTVIDTFGFSHTYDKLVLATGSRAFVPPDAPMDQEGVFTMRSKTDADNLKDYIQKDERVLIIGGGLLGLELSAALREMGIDISIVQLSSRLMERQLDKLASSLLREQVEELGVDVFCNDQVQSILKKEHGRGFHVQLKSGKTLTTEAIVYAIGTRPNIELAQKAGLPCRRGILVNEYLQTEDDHILAMGEIAEYKTTLNGTTAAAEQQADIAARAMNGDLNSIYSGSLSMNILKFPGFDLCSLGMIDVPNEKSKSVYEEIVFIDKAKRYYKKCIVHNDRLVGAILMGDKLEFAEFKSLIESRVELSDKRLGLLRSGKSVEPIIGKLICACNNVGEGNIEKVVNEGCSDLRKLCDATGAGLGCGSCKPEVQAILDKKVEQALAV